MSRVAYRVAYTQKKPKTGKFSFFVSGFSSDDELIETRHDRADFDTEDDAVEAARLERTRYFPTPYSIAGVADTEAEEAQPVEVFQPEEVEFAALVNATEEEKVVLAEAARIVYCRAVGVRLWERYTHADSDDVARLLRACAK